MYPTDDQSNGRVGMPPSDQRRPLTPPPRDPAASKNAAADIIRGQLNAIYAKSEERTNSPQAAQSQPIPAPTQTKPPQPKPQAEPQPNPTPTQSTHHAMRTAPIAEEPKKLETKSQATQAQSPVHTQVSADQWKQYHSAWQKYYQMYYERYYAGNIAAKNREISRLTKETQKNTPNTSTDEPTDPQAIAIKELRSQIQQKVRESAQKVKKSRHFIPAICRHIGPLSFHVFTIQSYYLWRSRRLYYSWRD